MDAKARAYPPLHATSMRSMRSFVSSALRTLRVSSLLALFVLGCTVGATRTYTVEELLDGSVAPHGPVDARVIDAGERCVNAGSTIGRVCSVFTQCDDGCFCNGVEACTQGRCVAGTAPVCADTIDCTSDTCEEAMDSCLHRANAALCSDNIPCNGFEVCDVRMGCLPAARELFCSDENACTLDSCDNAVAGGCVHVPRDADDDGFRSAACGGDDCNDDPDNNGAAVNPRATEICDNRIDDNCNNVADSNDTACRPMNDTCEGATVLPGPGDYQTSTRDQRADYTLVCGTATHADVVYRFTLSEAKDVRVTTRGLQQGALAIRDLSSCATATSDLRCRNGVNPLLLRKGLPPGEYALIIKASTSAGFDFSVAYENPTPFSNADRCTNDTVDLRAMAPGGGTFTGNFEDTDNHYALSCHAGTRRDAAYRLQLTEPSDVRLESTGGFIAMTTDCAATTNELGCRGASLVRRGVPAGTYYVLLESNSDTANYSLTATITAPPAPRLPGDVCGTAVDITSAPGMLDLATLEQDERMSCQTPVEATRNGVFRFTLTESHDVTVVTSGATNAVTLQTECGVATSELRCRTGLGDVTNPGRISVRNLAAGTYYVMAQNTRTTGTLGASLETRAATTPAVNEVCVGAPVLLEGTTVRDSLAGWDDNAMTGTCTTSTPALAYPDAYYTFTLSEPRFVNLVARSLESPAQPVYLTLKAGGCEGMANQCATGAVASLNPAALQPAGTYVVIVEQSENAAARYSLTFSTVAP